MDSKGIKETQEALIAVLKVAEIIVPHLKDGFQANQDLPAIFNAWMSDAEFQAKLKAGIEGIHEVPAEIKDISVGEGIALVGAIYPEVVKLLELLSKKA
jgi:hypothetical protein